MKLKTFNHILLLGMALAGFTSCNDFLDREPEDKVTDAVYFTSEADLAAYAINLYNFRSVSPGSWGIGFWADDNGTDNQASVGYSSFWAPGEWKVEQSVGNGSAWDFKQIRHCNYGLKNFLSRYAAGQIQGSDANIRHYIGELYVLRAYAYFDKLQDVGDFPIVTEPLPDQRDSLVKYSHREPSYKVARFILSDLDEAKKYLLDKSPAGKNRVSKDVADLLRSRVALFEGTWLKYHKGTAFVPGGTGWPGNAADIQGFDIDSEITFFLDEAMKSAKAVGDKYYASLDANTDAREGMDASFNSLNPYYTMFCDNNMEDYNEVLMWRQFSQPLGVTHNIQRQLANNGGGSGWTRGLVNSFVMRNGYPIYDSRSGYKKEWEEQTITATLQDRDSRIQIFTKRDGDVDCYVDGRPNYMDPTWIVKGNNETRMVTGYAIKKGKHYRWDEVHDTGESGSLVFRASEALLNYMEACVELKGSVDDTADKYWKALRRRAKVTEDYMLTVNATNMQEEAKGDWGAYSHNQLVSSLLYNVRRERRNELIGEGMRMMDLRRWRALDQVNGYQIEGMRYWGSSYEGKLLQDGIDLVKVDVDGGKGNMSDRQTSGVYIRPYQISKINNSVFDGYRFTEAHYLSPLPQSVFRQTAEGDQSDLNTSVIYQNPGWPKVAGQGPTE